MRRTDRSRESVVAKPDISRFECPNCAAKYRLVRVEADPKLIDRPVTCLSCGAPLQGREGALALKYFLDERPPRQAGARRFG
jgi:predicted RNA-binding Zn-ribbon protein involved in translation (DUF1610 family)